MNVYTDKPLRRKGQGETERPICPNCLQDLDRASIRGYNKEKGTQPYKSFAWVCVACNYIEWDKKSQVCAEIN
jgi:hypothetical protein